MTSPWQFERERAYSRLTTLIFGGGLEPGAPLSERRLAERLGMSRTPVREALRQLEQEGVVEVRNARGTFVRPVSCDDIADVYRVRDTLECLAAGQAAARGGSAALTTCGHRLRLMARDPSAFSATELDDAGTEFHRLLEEAAGSLAIAETMRLFRMRFRIVFHLPRYFDRDDLQSTLSDHIAIFDAVEARDSRLAEKQMREHLKRGLEIRLKLEARRPGLTQAAPEASAAAGAMNMPTGNWEETK